MVAAFDNWELAVKCYNHNNENECAEQLDLSDIDSAYAAIYVHHPNIIIGSPPCQDFSNAGLRAEGERANLTYTYAEIVTRIMPDYFVMENVPRAKKSDAYTRATKLYAKCGYGLTEVVLDASRCGVPQHRSRFFCIGARGDSNGFLLGNIFSGYIQNEITVSEYFLANGYDLNIDAYYRHPRTYERRAIFSVDEVSPTIRGVNRPRPGNYTLHTGDVVDMDELIQIRNLSLTERAYIQTFPANFDFEEIDISTVHLEQMIGNAVPVQLAAFVAQCLNQYIGGEHMQDKTRFAQWLRSEKKYTDRTISDTFSRINRALNLLPADENMVDHHYIADLEATAGFQALPVDIRSQIRRALRQLIAYHAYKD